MEKGLGRVFIPDDRDKNYPLRAIMPKAKTDRDYKYWFPNGWTGNQGNTPQCVAYAWLHYLEDGGITQNHKNPPVMPPEWFYKECQKNDYWPGENYPGTSVRAGAGVAQREGYISNYWWTWDIEEAVDAVMNIGPVVLGVDWYSNMSQPDLKNIIRPTGTYQGGHAIEWNGVNKKTELCRIKNSWGRKYGNNGYAYISFNDLAKLLAANGEVCIANEIRKI